MNTSYFHSSLSDMVSEPGRGSYAAAVSGETSRGARSSSPVQAPIGMSSPAGPQRNLFGQRSNNVEDIENPLSLNSNDNSSTVLVTHHLNGSSNYSTWCISMRIALEVKNKWTIVTGSTAAPDPEDRLFAAWRRCNLMICAWLFRSVSPAIAQSVMHMERAKDVWEDLRRRFAQRDPNRISALQNEIYTLKQGTMTVSDYYTKCRTLWEEMNTMRPLPICKCVPRCTCGLVEEIQKDREIDQVIRFLQGLNADYDSLKTGVLVLDPLPEVYRVFVMAEKLERQINLTNLNFNNMDFNQANAVQNAQISTDDAVAAVNAFSGKRNFNGSNGKAKCVL